MCGWGDCVACPFHCYFTYRRLQSSEVDGSKHRWRVRVMYLEREKGCLCCLFLTVYSSLALDLSVCHVAIAHSLSLWRMMPNEKRFSKTWVAYARATLWFSVIEMATIYLFYHRGEYVIVFSDTNHSRLTQWIIDWTVHTLRDSYSNLILYVNQSPSFRWRIMIAQRESHPQF